MSPFDSFGEISNIRMKEGESIAAFSNLYLGLLPADFDPEHYHMVHDLSAGFRPRCRRRMKYGCTTTARAQKYFSSHYVDSKYLYDALKVNLQVHDK